jgi:hypothetical protein
MNYLGGIESGDGATKLATNSTTAVVGLLFEPLTTLLPN